MIAWFVRDIWYKYHSWYFKIVSNLTRLTAREITYNNFEISFVVFMQNITTNNAIIYTNMKVRLNSCFEIFCTLLQYFDFSLPYPTKSCIINPAVQKILYCEPFITEYLFDETLTETATDLWKVLSNIQSTWLSRVQSKIPDSILVFQEQYLKGKFSVRPSWHMIVRFLWMNLFKL